MVLQHLGHNVSVQQVLAVHSSYTDIAEVQNLLIHFGIKGTSIISGGFDNSDKLVIALFHDDSTAEPNVAGAYEHYSVVYAQDAVNVYMANPWGGRLDTVPLTKFNPAYIAGVVIPIAINTAPPSIGERPVTLNGLTNSTVVKIQNGRGSIAFSTPFTHTPVVVVSNGDVNACSGSIALAAVANTGFQIVAHNAQGAVLAEGTLVRVNWIAA